MPNEIPRKAVRVRIEGRVQGVGYRAWVEATARGMGLDGWVANRRDGGVETSLSGPGDRVDAMIAACHDGPRHAVVAMVKVFDETDPPPPGFEVRPTR